MAGSVILSAAPWAWSTSRVVQQVLDGDRRDFETDLRLGADQALPAVVVGGSDQTHRVPTNNKDVPFYTPVVGVFMPGSSGPGCPVSSGPG
ncbi:hypothetical protein [Saccharopolyspora phatthalungensis]|uniref:Uncharacterized protein n=1 Tax=Saccharopolyspora phatthalungensis TaxID=664693 RepID=A0A840QJW4_9PSEU|nr:hypothetical protein [Saccharopolyspora phatthalungensis]MBB5159708.1 hypothetical protein [Saccharopolyspora phatthalungensis]